MYGDEKTDPVVRYYDQTLAITASDDIAWFVSQAQTAGGPVLDLACGTGRIAIALAKAGLEVTAMDSSPGMLAGLRKKLANLPTPVESRITVCEGKMHAFSVPRSFPVVICCDAFFHNLTVDSQLRCLGCIASHLTPGGRFVFNIPNPTIAFLGYAAGPEGQAYRKRDEYTLGDSNDTVLVEQAHRADLFAQTITTKLRFTRLGSDRIPVEIGESSWMTRFTFRFEAIHLLHRSGFEIASLTGDYRGAPVSQDSQLVFVAKLRDDRGIRQIDSVTMMPDDTSDR